jgi:hypothetical protein
LHFARFEAPLPRHAVLCLLLPQHMMRLVLT